MQDEYHRLYEKTIVFLRRDDSQWHNVTALATLTFFVGLIYCRIEWRRRLIWGTKESLLRGWGELPAWRKILICWCRCWKIRYGELVPVVDTM